MNLVKVISASLDVLNRRIVKILRFGLSDVQTTYEAMPFGLDSCALKDMVAVYSETGEKGKTVIIGYLNKNQIATKGEFRTYSLKSDGSVSFYIHQKDDETCEIGGNADNLVRYSPLNTEMLGLASSINAELVKIAAGLSGVGGVYTPLTISIDVSAAKIDEIKTL